MTGVRVVAFDPGPIPGLVGLSYLDGRLIKVDVLQVSAHLCVQAFTLLMAVGPRLDNSDTYVAGEQFVIGKASMRSGSPGARTRDMVGELLNEATKYNRTYPVQRPAVTVKQWATDKRLKAAGLIDPTKGCTHARDAARHALYCAVHDAGIPDPYSKEASQYRD